MVVRLIPLKTDNDFYHLELTDLVHFCTLLNERCINFIPHVAVFGHKGW